VPLLLDATGRPSPLAPRAMGLKAKSGETLGEAARLGLTEASRPR
jgi:hypothetical protein